MSSQNSNAIEKACLLSFFQVIIIALGFSLIAMNTSFEQTVQLDLKCMTISDMHKLCISMFERNDSLIPTNKAIEVKSLHGNNFKILMFEQNPNKFKTVYKNEYQEYFQLVDYNMNVNAIANLQLDHEVKEITQFLKVEKAVFLAQTFNTTQVHPSTGFAVFYFLVDNLGPKVPQPQVQVTYPTYNSIHLTNKLCLIECFGGILFILLWTCYQVSTMKRPSNQGICQNPQVSKINRPIQFLLNFGMNNLIFFLTINNFWNVYGLGFVNQLLGFQVSLVPMTQGNVYESPITLFPEWLMLGYFVYLVAERYYAASGFGLVVAAGLFSAGVFVVPLYWPQFIFELAIVAVGLLMAQSNKVNKLTIPLVFTAINLLFMVLIKMRWANYDSESNDFVLRFAFNQIFIVSNLLALFFNEDQIAVKENRKYIPYEEYSMEEEPQFGEHQTVPQAQKI